MGAGDGAPRLGAPDTHVLSDPRPARVGCSVADERPQPGCGRLSSRYQAGPRVWLNRGSIPVPEHHRGAPHVLSAVAASGIPLVVWELMSLRIRPHLLGGRGGVRGQALVPGPDGVAVRRHEGSRSTVRGLAVLSSCAASLENEEGPATRPGSGASSHRGACGSGLDLDGRETGHEVALVRLGELAAQLAAAARHGGLAVRQALAQRRAEEGGQLAQLGFG